MVIFSYHPFHWVLLAFPWESDGAEIEFAEKKEDTGSEVLEGTEAASISLDGLNSRVQALRSGISEPVMMVIEEV